jgi:hypothetical protein
MAVAMMQRDDVARPRDFTEDNANRLDLIEKMREHATEIDLLIQTYEAMGGSVGWLMQARVRDLQSEFDWADDVENGIC